MPASRKFTEEAAAVIVEATGPDKAEQLLRDLSEIEGQNASVRATLAALTVEVGHLAALWRRAEGYS